MRTPPSAAPIHADADCLQAKFTVRSDATTADGGTEEFDRTVTIKHEESVNTAGSPTAAADAMIKISRRDSRVRSFD